MHSYYVSSYKSGFVEGFRRQRGYILASQRKPDLKGSCSIASHHILSERSEQNSFQTSTHCLWCLCKLFSNLKGSMHDVFRGHSAAKVYLMMPSAEIMWHQWYLNDVCVCSSGGMILTSVNWSTGTANCPSASLFTSAMRGRQPTAWIRHSHVTVCTQIW